MNNKSTFVGALLGILAPVAVWAADVPHIFQPGQPLRAAEINENFAALTGSGTSDGGSPIILTLGNGLSFANGSTGYVAITNTNVLDALANNSVRNIWCYASTANGALAGNPFLLNSNGVWQFSLGGSSGLTSVLCRVELF